MLKAAWIGLPLLFFASLPAMGSDIASTLALEGTDRIVVTYAPKANFAAMQCWATKCC